jgi:hypothetical protein
MYSAAFDACAVFTPHFLATQNFTSFRSYQTPTSIALLPIALQSRARDIQALDEAANGISGSASSTSPPRLPLLRRLSNSTWTVANQRIAVSYAIYTVVAQVLQVWPGLTTKLQDYMRNTLFLDPSWVPSAMRSPLISDPADIGVWAAANVLAARNEDGANEWGREPGTRVSTPGTTSIGVPFTDYTGYWPVNQPQAIESHTQCSELRDPGHWQPLRVKILPAPGVTIPPTTTGPQTFASPFSKNKSQAS